MKRLYNWLCESRTGICCSYIFGSVLLSLFIGLIFFLIASKLPFIDNALTVFFVLFAFMAVAGILVLLTKMKPNYCLGYGAALYYGSILISIVCNKWWGIGGSDRYLIGLIFMILICYISWLKYFKEKHDADDEV